MVKINGLPFISPTIYHPDKVDYYYTNTNTSYELAIPYGVKKIIISLIGGGGGGTNYWIHTYGGNTRYLAGSGGGSGYIAHNILIKGKDFQPKDTLLITVGVGGPAAATQTDSGSDGGTSIVYLKRQGNIISQYYASGGQGSKKFICNVGADIPFYLSRGGDGGFGGGGAAPAYDNYVSESYGSIGGHGGTIDDKKLTPGQGAYSLLTNDSGQYVQYGNQSHEGEGTVWMPDRYSGGGAPVKGDVIISDPLICTGDGRFHLFRSNFNKRDQYSKQIAGSVRGKYRAFCCMFQDLNNSLYYLGPGGNGGQAYAYENPNIEGYVLGAYGGGYLNAQLVDDPPSGTARGSGGCGQGAGANGTNASAGTNGVVGIRMFYR